MQVYLFTPEELFSVASCFTFILGSLFFSATRWGHMCRPYDRRAGYFYPARRIVSLAYLTAVVLLPYLFHWHSPDARFFVRVFLLFYIPIFPSMAFRQYFFSERRWRWLRLVLAGGVPGVFLLILFVYACLGDDTLMRWQGGLIVPITETVCVLLAVYLLYTTSWLVRRIHYYLRGEYSNEEDFPVRFAKGVVFIPLMVLLICWGAYLSGNFWILGSAYLFITVVAFAILLVILHPQRTGTQLVEQEMERVADRVVRENEITVPNGPEETMQDRRLKESRTVSPEVLDRLEQELRVLVEEGELFLNPNLTMTELAVQLKTNRSYLSQVFRNRFHSSFYGYINRLRIRYAIRYAHEHPEATRRDIAAMSGFGSVRTMNRVREEFASDEEF